MNIFFDVLKAALSLIPYNEFEDRERKEQKERDKRYEKLKDDLSLQCRRCNDLAAPIQGTGNRYRCTCGNQFAAAWHNI